MTLIQGVILTIIVIIVSYFISRYLVYQTLSEPDNLEEIMTLAVGYLDVEFYDCGHIWRKDKGIAPEKCPVCQMQAKIVDLEAARDYYVEQLKRP